MGQILKRFWKLECPLQASARIWQVKNPLQLLERMWTPEYPLHEAVVRSNLSMLEKLVQQADIDLDKRNVRGETALLLSLKMNRPRDLILCLLNAGCDVTIPDEYGRTPLHEAVWHNSIEMMCELIKRGADVNVHDCYELTPLYIAIWKNNLVSTNLLLSCGAEGYYDGCIAKEALANDCSQIFNQILR